MKKFDVIIEQDSEGVHAALKRGWEPYGVQGGVTYLKREGRETATAYQTDLKEELFIQREHVARLAKENHKLQEENNRQQDTIRGLVTLDDAVANSRSQLQKEVHKLTKENTLLMCKLAASRRFADRLRTRLNEKQRPEMEKEAAHQQYMQKEVQKLKEENAKLVESYHRGYPLSDTLRSALGKRVEVLETENKKLKEENTRLEDDVRHALFELQQRR